MAAGLSRFQIDEITVDPLPYGLLSVARVHDVNNGHWAGGIEVVDSFACASTQFADDPCDDTPVAAQPATPTGGDLQWPSASTAGDFTIHITRTGGTVKDVTVPFDTNKAGLQTLLDTALGAGVAVVGNPKTVTGKTTLPITFPNDDKKPTITLDNNLTPGGTAPTFTVADSTPGTQASFTRAQKTALDGLPNPLDFDPFSIYVMRNCMELGNLADAQGKAMKALTLNEGRAVEHAIWDKFLTTPHLQDLSPSGNTKLTPVEALAILEYFAASTYGGRATIHVSRDVGTLLTYAGVIQRFGNHLETVQGSLVASGGGYTHNVPGTTPGAAVAGSSYMFVTGPVELWRGNAFVSPAVRKDGSNVFVTLAERTYSWAHDCLIAAVKVDVTSGAQPPPLMPKTIYPQGTPLTSIIPSPLTQWPPNKRIVIGTTPYTWVGDHWQSVCADDADTSNPTPVGSPVLAVGNGVKGINSGRLPAGWPQERGFFGGTPLADGTQTLSNFPDLAALKAADHVGDGHLIRLGLSWECEYWVLADGTVAHLGPEGVWSEGVSHPKTTIVPNSYITGLRSGEAGTGHHADGTPGNPSSPGADQTDQLLAWGYAPKPTVTGGKVTYPAWAADAKFRLGYDEFRWDGTQWVYVDHVDNSGTPN